MNASLLVRMTNSFTDVWTDRRWRAGLILTVSSVLLLLLAAALATALTFRVDDATEWVEHTYQVRELAGRALMDLQDAELALRSPDWESRLRRARRLSRRPPAPARRPRHDPPLRARQSPASRPGRSDRPACRGLSSNRSIAKPERRPSAPAKVAASPPRGEGAASLARIRELFAAFDASEAELLGARQSKADKLRGSSSASHCSVSFSRRSLRPPCDRDELVLYPAIAGAIGRAAGGGGDPPRGRIEAAADAKA